MKWTDKDIDKLYSDSSGRLAFEYNEGYWNEFEAQDVDGAKAPLSDAAIDTMYAATSAGLAFDYKNDYWNELNASLPNRAGSDSPKPALTDVEIDAMYAASAAGLSFDYNSAYWNEFNTSLSEVTPTDAPKSALTDIEIDAMYAASAAGLTFDYKDSYWKGFNASFPADAVLSDSGIDDLYQESAGDLAFEYKPSYWEEFKGRIRRQRRPDFLWFVTAYSFVGVLGVMAFMNANSVTDYKTVTADSNKIETRNNKTPKSQLKVENQTKSGSSVNSGQSSPANSGGNETGVLSPSSTTLMSVSQYVDPNVLTDIPVIQTPLEVPALAQTLISPTTAPNNAILIGQDPDTLPIDPNTSAPSSNGTPRNVNLVETLENTANPAGLNGSEPNDPKYVILSQPLSVDQLETAETTVETEEEFRLPYSSQNPLDLSLSLQVPLPGSPLMFNRGAFAVAYVQGMGGLSQSLVIPSDKISNSFGVGIGMEVHKGNFTFNFGVNALVENHDDLVLNRTAKVYGFGSDVYQFKIDYKQMYTLEAMIGVGYNLGRHRIDLGVRPSFVMSSRVHIEEIGSSTTEFASDNDYNEARDLFGFMDGLHRFGIKPTIGYMLKVSPSISLGGNIGVELMPSINEGFINGVNNTLPIDGQLYIRKTLTFRKK
ncbi:MAG: hypothetical protein ACJA0U_001220 [Salibacteraceae bacterium]|jgi:hypothetical protein